MNRHFTLKKEENGVYQYSYWAFGGKDEGWEDYFFTEREREHILSYSTHTIYKPVPYSGGGHARFGDALHYDVIPEQEEPDRTYYYVEADCRLEDIEPKESEQPKKKKVVFFDGWIEGEYD